MQQRLESQGFQLVAAGWQCRFGEIDLLMKDRQYLLFVEVKLRKNAKLAQAREAVSAAKQKRLRTSAELFLMEHALDLQPRFDVAEVYAYKGTETIDPVIEYFEDAF